MLTEQRVKENIPSAIDEIGLKAIINEIGLKAIIDEFGLDEIKKTVAEYEKNIEKQTK